MRLEFTTLEQKELFENNIAFARSIAKKWSQKSSIEREEAESYAYEYLARAAILYNKDRGTKFLFYANYIIETAIRDRLRSTTHKKNVAAATNVSLDAGFLLDTINSKDDYKYQEVIDTIQGILSQYPDRKKRAVTKFLLEGGYTLKEMAEEFDISIRTMHKWVIHARKDIAKEMYK